MGLVQLARRTAIAIGLLAVFVEGVLLLASLMGWRLGGHPSLQAAVVGCLIAVLAFVSGRPEDSRR